MRELRRHMRFFTGRPANADEVRIGARFLDAFKKRDPAPAAAWRAYAQILVCANEFMFVDWKRGRGFILTLRGPGCFICVPGVSAEYSLTPRLISVTPAGVGIDHDR